MSNYFVIQSTDDLKFNLKFKHANDDMGIVQFCQFLPVIKNITPFATAAYMLQKSTHKVKAILKSLLVILMNDE